MTAIAFVRDMFQYRRMQMSFGFGSGDFERWHRKLGAIRDTLILLPPRSPIGQLVKSIISSRTLDAVSQRAFDRLVARFKKPARLSEADPGDVKLAIDDVTYAADKARYVVETMRRLRASPHGFDLTPLGDQPLDDALAFLEHLPGVARKVSASTLNASTLSMPVLIVDTHVLRVLQRLAVVRPHADNRAASERVTAAMPHWTGADFLAFHIELKRLGEIVCRVDGPRCALCPLAGDCPTASSGRARAWQPRDIRSIRKHEPEPSQIAVHRLHDG